MTEQREFQIGEHMLKDICPVCKNKFKLKEKIVLCPIQEVRKGWGNAIAIPIHTKCYWIEEDEK